MATYHKSKNLWEARRRLPNGQRKSFYGPTEEEAEASANAYTGQSLSSIPNPTLSRFAIRIFIPTIQHHSLKYRRNVAWALDNHIMPAIGNRKITELRREHLQGFLAVKLQTLSRKSVQNIRGVLYSIFQLAEADDVIAKNPVRYVKLPPTRPSVKPAPPTIEELGIILARAEGHKLYRSILLAAGIGLRRSEIFAVTAKSFRGDELFIEQQKIDGALQPLKTHASRRRILLPPGFREEVLECENASDAYVVRHAKEVLPPGVTLHTLRHAFATGIEALGCPRSVTAAILGHSSRSVTDIYARVDPRQVQVWIYRWLLRLLSYAEWEGVQAVSARAKKVG